MVWAKNALFFPNYSYIPLSRILKNAFSRCGRLLEKVKLMLKVEADDTEDMVTMDSEAERTLQDRIQILERHFNIKVIVLDLGIRIQGSSGSGSRPSKKIWNLFQVTYFGSLA